MANPLPITAMAIVLEAVAVVEDWDGQPRPCIEPYRGNWALVEKGRLVLPRPSRALLQTIRNLERQLKEGRDHSRRPRPIQRAA